MRLRGKRAQRHRPAHEVLHDRVYRLDTFYTLYMFYTAKLKLRPERHMAVLVDVVGIAVEARVVAVPHRLAEVDEPRRRPEVLLSAFALTVFAAGRQCVLGLRHSTFGIRQRRSVVGCRLSSFNYLLDVFQFQTSDGRCDAGEILGDDLRTEAHCFEDARGAVGAERRDAHLRHDLHQPLADRRHVVRRRPVRGGHRAPRNICHRREREIRIHRRRAESEQDGEVVHFAHLAGLDDYSDRRTSPRLDERLVHRRDSKERGYPLCVLCVLCG